MPSTWVGLDVGTSSLKAVLFDDAGGQLAVERAVTPWSSSDAGTEIDPDALARAALDVVVRVAEADPERRPVAGVGVTSMGETGVLVGSDGTPVGPAIAWHDTRDEAEVGRLRQEVGADELAGLTGKPLRSQFTLTKHAWQVRHLPGAADATRWFTVADWVVRALSGVESCDLALAGRTGWLDPLERRWLPDLLAWSGASTGLLPDLAQPGDRLGLVSLGHDRLDGAVVTTAGHDHQAALVGTGLDALGAELDSCGTAEAIVRLVPGTLDRAVVRDLARGGITTDVGIEAGSLCLLGGTRGGQQLQQALDDLGIGRDGLAHLDDLALEAVNARDDSERVLGTRWREAVETATAEAAVLHDRVCAAAGAPTTLVVAGGWRHSRTVLDAKRRLLGDLTVSTVDEAGARGAATLAARAAGHLGVRDAWGPA